MKKHAIAARFSRVTAELGTAQRKVQATTALARTLKARTQVAKLKAKESRKEWKQLRRNARVASTNEEAARKELRVVTKQVAKLKSKLPPQEKKTVKKAKVQKKRAIATISTADKPVGNEVQSELAAAES